MNDKTGGSAFPAQPIYRMPDGTEIIVPQDGMTLRDYFAAKALPSIIAQYDVFDGRTWSNGAWIAYQVADAMIEARGQKL